MCLFNKINDLEGRGRGDFSDFETYKMRGS